MGDGDEVDFCSSRPAEGYSVCGNCFDDDQLKAFIESQADTTVCDFCGRNSRTRPIAAPLDDVVELILAAVNREYQRAVEALGYDSAEGGYQGSHWDSHDLLAYEIGLGLPNDDEDRLLDIISDCLGDEPWCERNPYALREDERLLASWEQFCEFIKYRRRYFFLQQQEDDSSPLLNEYLVPSELLEFISKTAEEHRLVRMMPAGALIYRARQRKPGQTLHSPYDFGPPPVEHAIRSNRMSPAGIVMFYGSDEPATAIAEIDDDLHLGIAVGTFRTTREAALLDLTSLPRRLGFFEQQPESSTFDRYAINFLHSFVKSLAAKVQPGNREHIDYVPTQVVTEWFRTVFRHANSPLDGLRYPSAQRPGGKSVVLFADRHGIVLTSRQIIEFAGTEPLDQWWLRTRHENAWLKLVRRRVVR